jgi:transmembrane sensor
VSARERLRREAADWVARLNGPCGPEDRAAFERWYRSSPERAEAYDRVSGLFQEAGQLERPDARQAAARREARRSGCPRPIGYGVAAALACALLAFVILSTGAGSRPSEPGQQLASFAAGGPGGRRIVLSDRSIVLLSTGTLVEVAFGPTDRRLRLVRGEGRFSVARDPRPFIVTAGGAEIVARGTEFVVRVGQGRTSVALLEGQLEVSYASSAERGTERRVARLVAGEQLVIEAQAGPAAPARSAGKGLAPRAEPPAMLQFDSTPLIEAVEQANRHGSAPIRLGDPALAGLRVTGAFRAGDTADFAEGVAEAFDLELRRAPDGLWLHPRQRGVRQR